MLLAPVFQVYSVTPSKALPRAMQSLLTRGLLEPLSPCIRAGCQVPIGHRLSPRSKSKSTQCALISTRFWYTGCTCDNRLVTICTTCCLAKANTKQELTGLSSSCTCHLTTNLTKYCTQCTGHGMQLGGCTPPQHNVRRERLLPGRTHAK